MQRSVPKHALDSLAGPSLAAAFVAAAAQAHPRQAPAPVGGLPALGAEIARCSCLVLTPVEEMLVAFEEAATQVYLRARSVSLLRRERENQSRP